jgi:hypothetical protein
MNHALEILCRSLVVPGCLALALALSAGGPARAAPDNTWYKALQNIGQCLIDKLGASDQEITVQFAMRRDGSLFGKPRITYSRLTGDAAEQSRFLQQFNDAFAGCFPARISDSLGAAIAGSPFTILFRLSAGPSAD